MTGILFFPEQEIKALRERATPDSIASLLMRRAHAQCTQGNQEEMATGKDVYELKHSNHFHHHGNRRLRDIQG